MHNETIPVPLLHRDPDSNQEPHPESALVLKLMAGALFILIVLMVLVPLLR